MRGVRRFPGLPGAELAGVDAEYTAVVELVALGYATVVFPAVEVVVHAVNGGHGRVASCTAGVNEPAGHLALVPAPVYTLLAQPHAEFAVHNAYLSRIPVRCAGLPQGHSRTLTVRECP